MAVLFAALPAAAGPAQNPDDLFEKKLYQEALDGYEALAKTSSGDALWRARYRAAECRTLLFRYGEALQYVKDAGPPRDPLWKGRWLILKTELYREFIKQYGRGARGDAVEGGEDPARKTPREMHAALRAGYEGLWGLRETLAARPLEEERDFVDLKDVRPGDYPSLWDFAVLRWTGYLLEEEPDEKAARPKALEFVKDAPPFDPGRRPSAQAGPAPRAAFLMEHAARLPGRGRAQAAESWRLSRLLLPLRQPDQFDWSEDRKAERRRAAATLRGWLEGFETDEPRAAAGLEAAQLQQQLDEPAAALETCAQVERRWPGALGARRCKRLRGRILQPELGLSVVLDGTDRVPRLGTRNLKEAYLRVYSAPPEELLSLQRNDWERAWSNALNQVDNEVLLYYLGERKPLREWRQEVPLKKPGDLHRSQTTKVELPRLEPGLYLLVASDDDGFRVKESFISGILLNKTGLILVGTAGPQARERELLHDPKAPRRARDVPAFHFYALDGRTGRPAAGASLDVQHDWDRHRELRRFEFDRDGMAQLPVTLRLTPRAGNSHSVDPLARRGEDLAFWSSPQRLGFSVPEPIQIFIDTDRPVYRPGQKVKLKVTVVARHPEGLRPYRGAAKVHVRAADANGMELYKTDQPVGAMGSLEAEFEVPAGRLLGSYSVHAGLNDWGSSFGGSRSFQVEEYKRPEFEATLEEAKGPWRFGRPAEVRGEVRYYFGGPVPDAPVTIKVQRESYLPRFCPGWAWRWAGSDRTEVERRELKTDEKGRFSFAFTPQPGDPREADPLPARFTVEVEARDPGGRAITGERAFTAGKNAYLFEIEPPAGFLAAGKPAEAAVTLRNLDGVQVAGRSRYEVHRVTGTPSFEGPASLWGGFSESPSLDRLYDKVPDAERVAEGELRHDAKKPASLRLPGLKAGAYRLTLKAEDAWGGEAAQSALLLAADGSGRLPLPIATLTVPEHQEYQAGEKARILMGSADLPEAAFVEVWGGPLLLSRAVAKGGGIRVFEVPVTGEHRGGFTVRWFGARDMKLRTGEASVSVPRKDRRLSVSLRHDRVLRPGRKASWSVSAKDQDGRPVDGEALVAMFDRSLEHYVEAADSWVKDLYPDRPPPRGGLHSYYQVHAGGIPAEAGWVKRILDLFQTAIREPAEPMLRLNRTRLRYGRQRQKEDVYGMLDMSLESSRRAPAAPGEPKAEGESAYLGGRASREKTDKDKAGSAADKPVALRTNFAETAFFKPLLRLRGGKASFSFKTPEQLTGWRILGHVFTRDLKAGSLSEEALTRKDLMVRVELPRFFREGDSGALKAVVHNETDADLQARLAMSVARDGKDAALELGLKDLDREVKVPARGLAALSWPIEVPRGIAAYKIRAVVRAGELSDAEERDLPILPSRQRLIESVVVALDGDATKLLALKALDEADPTRESEALHLQIDPQLALVILNSIPFLVQYPHECVEQTLNRFVPMAIVNEVYKKHPKLAKAAANIPKRTTITPAWDRSDPRRLLSLLETPWEGISQGLKSSQPVMDMLDPAGVARRKEEALEKLKAAQLPGGGFPWFPGGREDAYMTLYVLDGFAEARRYGVEIPEDVALRAANYVANEIPKRLKPREEDVSMALYAAYVLTSFPRQSEGGRLGYAFAKAWLDYADKHADAMTPYGKAWAAYAYWRLGEKAKGDLYLGRALDGARQDPLTGVYWTPERNSWLWYTDTVEKHAFFLRTLQALRPKDPRIPGMAQWLLFNRKGSEWKSTKASAAAVYALLDFMKARGALDRGDEFLVQWGDVSETVQVGPDDWLSKPLRWSRLGAGAPSGAPKVVKRGPGFAYASLAWTYTTDKPAEASGPGPLELERRYYLRVKEGGDYRLKPLKSGDAVRVGDQVEVRVHIRARAQFEYVHLKDPKAAGFEAEELLSGWKWDHISRYEEPRDSLTNFFIPWLPHGEHVLSYRVRPTTAGRYCAGAAVLQSMYSPEFAAHSGGFELAVAE